MKLFRIVLAPGKDVGERLQLQIHVLVDQFEAFADVLGHDLGAVIYAKLAVLHFLVLSCTFWGGRAHSNCSKIIITGANGCVVALEQP